jgi:hypothetical protein
MAQHNYNRHIESACRMVPDLRKYLYAQQDFNKLDVVETVSMNLEPVKFYRNMN